MGNLAALQKLAATNLTLNGSETRSKMAYHYITPKDFFYQNVPYHLKDFGILTFRRAPKWSRGSSASIVSGYGLDDQEIEVRSPAGA
jgi:hypothetical protein